MIGRQKEIQELDEVCNREESSIVVLYGRRRIGKTFLIDEMFRSKRDCLFFTFTGSADQKHEVQLFNFKNNLRRWFGHDVDKNFSHWAEAFSELERAILKFKGESHKKVVIFLDEVPWVDKTSKNGYLSAIGLFWEEFCRRRGDIVIILCGSNASWIQKRILNDARGPLYQRLDKQILLKPFTLKETKEYLDERNFDLDEKTISEIYMVFGGVAKYLSFLDNQKSIAEQINELIFSIDGNMSNEFTNIMISLYSEKADSYKKLLETIFQNNEPKTKTYIFKRMGMTNGRTLNQYLDDLDLCGFIRSINKHGNKTQDTIYRISDPFILFYMKWVKPLTLNEINSNPSYWLDTVESQEYAIWTGFAFENIIINNIDLYIKARGYSPEIKKGVYYWKVDKREEGETGAQIDIVVEYKTNMIDLVECKYYSDVFTIDKNYSNILINKKEMFKKYGLTNRKRDLKTVLLTTYGVKKNSAYNNAKITKSVELKELFN